MPAITALPRSTLAAGTDEEAHPIPRSRAAITFADVYECYLDRVFAYVRARSDSAEDAADLTQQVFLQAFEGFSRFRGRDDQVAAWLFRIARNLLSNHWRRRRASVTWDVVPETLQPRTDHAVDAGLLRQEALLPLRALLRALKPDTQELLALRFVAQLTVPEIAAVIGKSDAATSKQLSRALSRLQEQYHAHA
jgi:RNA polymerase sigma-70 factor (ECF subfamily)